MRNLNYNRLLYKICILCLLIGASINFTISTEAQYPSTTTCSDCDSTYYTCKSDCDDLYNTGQVNQTGRTQCYNSCRDPHMSCSANCTPDGQQYRPSCPSSSGCANYLNNCDTACTADRDVCFSECDPNDNSCFDVCNSIRVSCGSFCNANAADCFFCQSQDDPGN